MKIFLSQLNPTVGDLKGNIRKVLATAHEGKKRGADLVVFPEMFITGYQLQDLVLKRQFLNDVTSSLSEVALKLVDGPMILIGGPSLSNGKIFNSYFFIDNGSVNLAAQKYHLPNSDIFDEKRYFDKGHLSKPIKIRNVNVGTPICEDIWYPDVVRHMSENGASLIISPNGSPYSRGKLEIRHEIARLRSMENGIPFVYLNLVGGQDDQVFDGGSFIINSDGKIISFMPQFEEATCLIEMRNGILRNLETQYEIPHRYDEILEDYRAMCLALRDYIKKSGFSKVLIGLSGGIDSALVALIAVDSLGKENVTCIMLPSIYTSDESINDAEDLAKNLGCHLETLSIEEINDEILKALKPLFQDKKNGLAEENIQARVRGLLLMAVSNKTDSMLLTTGNKSEVAVGYSTIYGDMSGGYNPIKDLYKTKVFQISAWRNNNHFSWMLGPGGIVIPKSIIRKPPTAELRPNQKDQDSLPPYDVLDKILEGLIEKDLSVEELVKEGCDRKIIRMVESLIYSSEYKRYQAAPGVHLTDKSFWLGRRYPIVQKWRDES